MSKGIDRKSGTIMLDGSLSFYFFTNSIRRTRELLKWASVGLTEGKKSPDRILRKIEAALTGEPAVYEAEDDGSKMVSISLNRKEVLLIHQAVTMERNFVEGINFHLRNVALVAAWSSFESYLQGILIQFYNANSSELGSEKQITFRELISSDKPPAQLLIEREVNDFGRLSLDGMVAYVKSRLKYDLVEGEIASLKATYFLRNVVAHNSGFVRSSQKPLIPHEVVISNNQIQIPADYLERQIDLLSAAVDRMDGYLIKRWDLRGSKHSLDDLPQLPEFPPAPK